MLVNLMGLFQERECTCAVQELYKIHLESNGSLKQNTHIEPQQKLAGFSAMTAGAWLGWPSSTINGLKEDEVLVGGDISTMVALMDFGNMLSPIPAGYFMDIVGRKLTLLATAVVYLISSASVIGFHNKWMIFLARMMAGIGKGIAFSVVPIYLAEIANVQIRGALSTMFIGFLNLGMFYGYIVGPHVNYTIFNLAILLTPISFLATFCFFPESPYYLLMKSREGAAKKSLIKYRQVQKGESDRMAKLEHELTEMSRRVEQDMKNKGRFIDLVSTSGNRRALLIISMLAFFQRSSGISPTLAYSTKMMPKTGGGLTIETYMIIFSALLIIANYLALPLVDRIGRKPLLLISSITTGLCTLVTGIFYQLTNSGADLSAVQWIPYVTLVLFSITYSLGIGFLPSTLVGELFPTNVKSHAGAVSAIILAAVSFSVNKVFLEVSETFGNQMMYWYFTLACFLCAIFVQFFVFETRGKSFGEIQEILNSRNRTAKPGEVQVELNKKTEV
ncbi:unnamed protein product [Nesidiocoris tenuis]|uniref:Major facilitator superfamily (MFS) profile domain-containing protein n=1 Tax=Nesidiocoris tenuis TaxID=355587 RepID=A0A6H5G336_9HEMI|nr:unnamed protein product [Nesidiocoris tenuis]